MALCEQFFQAEQGPPHKWTPSITHKGWMYLAKFLVYKNLIGQV